MRDAKVARHPQVAVAWLFARFHAHLPVRTARSPPPGPVPLHIARAAARGRTADRGAGLGAQALGPAATLGKHEGRCSPDAGTAGRGAAYSQLGLATLVAARGGSL